MGWLPDDVIAALRKSGQIGIYIHMATVPPLRLWYGVNDVPQRMSYVEDEDATYLGGGRLLGIPNFEVPINGVGDRIEFTISGIDPLTAASIMDSIPEVRGAPFHVGITTLNDHYQPMSQIIPIASGRASFITEKSEPVTGTTPFSTSIGLSVGFGSVTRSRNAAVMWSHEHQQLLYPGDLFCKNTPRQARGTQVTWPRF